jgi:hypothetical protein
LTPDVPRLRRAIASAANDPWLDHRVRSHFAAIGAALLAEPDGARPAIPNADAMLATLIRLHREGILSEGQVARATGLDRISIRKLADEQGAAAPAAPVTRLLDPDLPTEGVPER